MDTQPLPDFKEDLSFLKSDLKKDLRTKVDTQIPLPSSTILKKMFDNLSDKEIEKNNLGQPFKHEKAYEAFCKWYRLPLQLKKPKTERKFEEKWGLPKGYCESNFIRKEDFNQKTSQHFFEWMMGLWPDVVYAIYKDAVRGSAPQAKAFSEIILKRLDVDKPAVTISPMMLVGVPQDKIDKLFIPKEIQSVKEVVPIIEEK